MSKGLQETGKYIRATIDLLLMLYGEVPLWYVAARLENERRETFKNPSEASKDIPRRWIETPPGTNLRNQMRKEVKNVVLNHTEYELLQTHPYDLIKYRGEQIEVLETDWKTEIRKELHKHRNTN